MRKLAPMQVLVGSFSFCFLLIVASCSKPSPTQTTTTYQAPPPVSSPYYMTGLLGGVAVTINGSPVSYSIDSLIDTSDYNEHCHDHDYDNTGLMYATGA